MNRTRFWILTFGILVAVLAVASTNPGNFLTKRSEGFSVEAFEQLRIGDPEVSAIRALGEPIKVDQAGPIGTCQGCKVLLFMGDPPRWVWRYDEAWILVNPSGTIADKIRMSEP